MATSNFYCRNTSDIFAIGMNHYITQEDIDANDWGQEELGKYDEFLTRLNFEDSKNYAQELLEAQGWDACDCYDSGSNRSYPGTIIASKTKSLNFAGITLEVTIEASVVSGYYEGACFDLDAELKIYDNDGYEVASYEDFDVINNINEKDVISEQWHTNIGLRKIHGFSIIKHLQAFIEELKEEAESCFKKAADYRLGVYAHFSNGETWYIDLDKNKAS